MILAVLAVGVLWGCTNPFIAKAESRRGVVGLFSDWRFLLPYGLNQLGAVAYALVLARLDVSIAHPLCNALALVCTAATAVCLGEKSLSFSQVLGILLVLLGSALCVRSRA